MKLSKNNVSFLKRVKKKKKKSRKDLLTINDFTEVGNVKLNKEASNKNNNKKS